MLIIIHVNKCDRFVTQDPQRIKLLGSQHAVHNFEKRYSKNLEKCYGRSQLRKSQLTQSRC